VGSYLNGWTRIGLVISIAWALGAGYWGYELGNRWNESAREDASSRLYQCLNDENLGPSSEICEQREREMDRIRAYQWPVAALVGLGPIPIAWAAAYFATVVTRRRRQPASE
jgi:hypothetical protein